MSYAIIRNEKYKRENLKGIFRHNERRNQNYSNKNIDKSKSYLNYSLKAPTYNYEKEFEGIRKKYNLKGQIKNVSNIVCEYMITSDNEFFDKIGSEETKRYFQTAYQFVKEYKDLGENYILSSVVHMDEDVPHMHLAFIPVVHTKDKNGNDVDKIACSEFWKEKDSYRQLQDAFYSYVIAHGFDLQRGESSDRKHLSVKEFKEVTNYNKTKKVLENMKLDLPKVPDIKDFNKLTIKRDEKIMTEIIKPKDKLIQELYQENIALQKELSKQVTIIDEVEKYQNEREKILDDNKELHNTMEKLEQDYKQKSYSLDLDFNNKKRELEDDFKNKTYNIKKQYSNIVHELEKENNHLYKIIDRFEQTIEKFIHWVCKKFNVTEEDEMIRNFEYEENTFINPNKQIEYEENSITEQEM